MLRAGLCAATLTSSGDRRSRAQTPDQQRRLLAANSIPIEICAKRCSGVAASYRGTEHGGGRKKVRIARMGDSW
jgi:hypothetical protein